MNNWWRHQDVIPLCLSHCLIGNLCHALLAARLSVLVVPRFLGSPCQNWEPRAMHPQAEARSSASSTCFLLKRAICALLARTTSTVCKGSGVSHKKKVANKLFPPEKDRRRINFVFLIDMKAFESHFGFPLLPFCSALSESLPLHFLSRDT